MTGFTPEPADDLYDLITGRRLEPWAAEYLEQREIDRVVERVAASFGAELRQIMRRDAQQ